MAFPLVRRSYAAALVFVASGCTLLEPYPGGEDPAKALVSDAAGPQGGTPQDPLINPPTDPTVSVIDLTDCPSGSDRGCTVALPGTGFAVYLGFQAPNENVLGGGIRIEGSPEVQWTLLQAVKDKTQGEILFSYVLPSDVCSDLANLCHTITTEQFAVVSDGAGGFAVSPPVVVDVVLQCATCDSKSCVEALPAGACRTCMQPDACDTLYENCYAPGAPAEMSEFADVFDAFLSESGILWTSRDGCLQGEALCQNAVDAGSCEF